MTGTNRSCIPNRESNELGVVSATADEPWARGLAERDAEAKVRRAGCQRFMQIVDRLDEVRLAEDEVQLVGFLDRNNLDIHDSPPVPPSDCRIHSTRTARLPGHAQSEYEYQLTVDTSITTLPFPPSSLSSRLSAGLHETASGRARISSRGRRTNACFLLSVNPLCRVGVFSDADSASVCDTDPGVR